MAENDAPAGKSLRREGWDSPTAIRRLGQRLLGRPSVVQRSRRRRAEIALTFDDGPSPWTAEVAGAFEAYDCHATFFLRGVAVEERPEAVAALAAAGHELGNHLWSHTDSSTLSRAEIRAELERTANAIEQVSGKRTRLVRPPYLKAPQEVATAARRSGVRMIVLASLTVSDWLAESPEQVFDPVLADAEAGDIVCLHDGISSDKRDTDSREPTAAAVKRLVPTLLHLGLQPVTVSELMR